jgi:hypothetical protein
MTRRKAKGLVGAHCMEPITIGRAADGVKGSQDQFLEISGGEALTAPRAFTTLGESR